MPLALVLAIRPGAMTGWPERATIGRRTTWPAPSLQRSEPYCQVLLAALVRVRVRLKDLLSPGCSTSVAGLTCIEKPCIEPPGV